MLTARNEHLSHFWFHIYPLLYPGRQSSKTSGYFIVLDTIRSSICFQRPVADGWIKVTLPSPPPPSSSPSPLLPSPSPLPPFPHYLSPLLPGHYFSLQS